MAGFVTSTPAANPFFLSPSTFGTTQQQTPSLFGNVSQPQPTFGVQATPAFGATQQQQQAPSLFGNVSQPQPTFGVQATPAFGATQQQTPSLFGNVSQSQPTFGVQATPAFGATQQQTPSLFGNVSQPTFGVQATPAFGTTQQPSLFGNVSQPTFGVQATSGFGNFQHHLMQQQQQQQQQQQVPQVDEQVAFHQSVFAVCKFGDERDGILANLNYIQAAWGAGKGYYNQTNPPILYNDKNVLYRFKAVGYSFLYNDTNEEGQVVIHIKKPHSKVSEEETQFIASLQSMLAKPNIFFKITGSKAMGEDTTVIILTADDRTSLRRILATELSAALLQPQFKPQMDNLGVMSVCAKVKPSPEQLKAYLDNPPAGVDPRVWKKAQEDNPDPSTMIPIPLLGYSSLKDRLEAQLKENGQHSERLRLLTEELVNVSNKQALMESEIEHIRRRYTALQHRVLSFISRNQLFQGVGVPVLAEEELKKRFDDLSKDLNSPKYCRGRLNELMSQMRLMSAIDKSKPCYSLDPQTLEQIKEFLTTQQGSIKHLVETVQNTMEYVQYLKDEIREHINKRGSN